MLIEELKRETSRAHLFFTMTEKEEEHDKPAENQQPTTADAPPAEPAPADPPTPATPVSNGGLLPTPKADDASHVSSITDSGSVMSRTSASIASVLSQTVSILKGELPEEDRITPSEFRPNPTKSISFGKIPMEFSNEDDDEEEEDHSSATSEISIDFLEDSHKEMTFGRRIALALINKKWYNPRAGESQADYEDDYDETTGQGRQQQSSLMVDTTNSQVATNGNNGQHAPPPLSPQSEGTAGYPARVTVKQFPSLERAWAYFEHVTLPRYLVEQKPDAPKKNFLVRAFRKAFFKGNKQLDKAEPGENHLPTLLYSPIFTPLKQMGGVYYLYSCEMCFCLACRCCTHLTPLTYHYYFIIDFGLGIGLYFSTLRAITVLTLLAGLINIVNFQYFASYEYSLGQPGLSPITLEGSAICTNKEWVPCPECNVTNWENDVDKIATVATTNVFDDEPVTLTFALKNMCDGATLQQGYVLLPFAFCLLRLHFPSLHSLSLVRMVNYGTLMFVLVGILVMNIYQKHMEVKYDEDEQTAQDYSIVITNPPHDANNPEEWRDYFRDTFDGAHTTCCTIAVDNDLLVKSLQERRECMRKIEMLVEPGTSLDDLTLARIGAEIERGRNWFQNLLAMVLPGIPELFGKATVLAAKIQGLAQQDYPVNNVFISFETEEAQRKVLTALSVGAIAANHNTVRVHRHNPQYLFRGDRVLRVKEPDEPSTVRWRDLNVKFPARFKQLVMTTLATIIAIVLIAILIWALHNINVAWSALAIAATNGIFPTVAKILTMGESHASEGGVQTSLYFKIAVFRWVNTAIIITIITVRWLALALLQVKRWFIVLTSLPSRALVHAAIYQDD